MAGHSESRTAVFAAIAANLFIAIIKFAAAALSGSSAMVAEGIHSLVDTGNGLLVLLGMKQSQRPADETHPFGYGKSLYFWTNIVAISIFGIGGGMSLYEGISTLRNIVPGEEMGDPTAAYIVLAISLLIEGASFTVAIRQFLRAKGDLGLLAVHPEVEGPEPLHDRARGQRGHARPSLRVPRDLPRPPAEQSVSRRSRLDRDRPAADERGLDPRVADPGSAGGRGREPRGARGHPAARGVGSGGRARRRYPHHVHGPATICS